MSDEKGKYRGTKEYKSLYERLITAAKNQGTVSYKEIGEILGIRTRGNHFSREVGWILGEISEDEVSNGRPMLSAIAVGVTGLPGEGFITLARYLDLLPDGEDQQQFWKKQCQAVYDCWKVIL